MRLLSSSLISILLVLTVFFNGLAQATDAWSMLSDASGASAYRHDDAYFVSKDTGFAVFFNTAEQNGYIYKTVNGGVSWTTSKVQPGCHFRSITFLNSKIGFAGNLGKGSYDVASTDTMPIYKTSNGGQTWTAFNPGPNALKGICAMFKVNDQSLYAVGRVRGPAHLVKTQDAGQTWSVIDLSPFGLGAAMDLYFFGPDTGYVVGMDATPYATGTSATYKGKIVYTTDGGLSWSTVLTADENPTYFWKIHFPTRETGYTTLQRNTATYSTVVYYKTTNKGASWTKNSIVTPNLGSASNYNFLAQSVGFVTANHGWIGGGGFEINFLETKDGGISWSNISYNNSARINKLRVTGNMVIAAGVRIHRYLSSEIVAALEDGLIDEEAPVSVYPVPAREYITVKLNALYWQKAVVTIHDLNGNEVKKGSVEGEGQVYVSDLTAGVYQLTVVSGAKVWLRKIIIE